MFKKLILKKRCVYCGAHFEMFERVTVCTLGKKTYYFGLHLNVWYELDLTRGELALDFAQQHSPNRFELVQSFLHNKYLTQIELGYNRASKQFYPK